MKSKLILAFMLTFTALAVGPQIPCILTWTDSTTAGVTGYWVYWRLPTGGYLNTQRIGVTSAQKPYDLRVLGLAKGQYYVMMTATNAQSESDPSLEVFWNYQNPNKPTSLTITSP